RADPLHPGTQPLPPGTAPGAGLAGAATQLPHLRAIERAADSRTAAGRARPARRQLPLRADGPLPAARLLRAVRRERPALPAAPVRGGGPALPLPDAP